MTKSRKMYKQWKRNGKISDWKEVGGSALGGAVIASTGVTKKLATAIKFIF